MDAGWMQGGGAIIYKEFNLLLSGRCAVPLVNKREGCHEFMFIKHMTKGLLVEEV